MNYLKRLVGRGDSPAVPPVDTGSEKDRIKKRMGEIHYELLSRSLEFIDEEGMPEEFRIAGRQPGVAHNKDLIRWKEPRFWEQVSMDDENERTRLLTLLSEHRELESRMKQYTAFSAPDGRVDYKNRQEVCPNDREGADMLIAMLSVDYGLSPHAGKSVESDLNDSLFEIEFAQKTIEENLSMISTLGFDTKKREELSTGEKIAYRQAIMAIRKTVDTFSLVQLGKLNDLIDDKFTMTSDDARKKQRAIALDVQLGIKELKDLVARGSEAIAVYEKPFNKID